LINPDILPLLQHKVVRFFSCSKRSALQCVHLCDMAPNDYTTNPSTSSAVWRACFPARRARAPRLAACRWLAGWAALAARMAEACHSLTTCCCSTGSSALAARLAEASRSLTACWCSAGLTALVACRAEASRSLTACCCSTDWAALAARPAEACRSLTACCCSTDWAALAALLAEAFCSLTACCCSALYIYTQSSGTVTHLSHTHTRQPPAYNRFDFLILEQVLHIEGWVLFLFLFFFLG